MDSKSTGTTTGLDISPATLFHQSTMYWQHPHLPWLTLFPRMSKANNTGFTLGEAESAALANDWADSFRALFQVSFDLKKSQCFDEYIERVPFKVSAGRVLTFVYKFCFLLL